MILIYCLPEAKYPELKELCANTIKHPHESIDVKLDANLKEYPNDKNGMFEFFKLECSEEILKIELGGNIELAIADALAHKYDIDRADLRDNVSITSNPNKQ